MGKYFSKYPIIYYNGQYARNLLARATLSNSTLNNTQLFYPYETKEQEQHPDVIADRYYKDPFYDWIISLCNKIIDPYYDYAIDIDTFDDFVTSKYGTLEAAKSTILYYQNNWAGDDSLIAISTYDALSTSLKKYWTAFLDYTGAVSGYTRKKEDWILETNRIVQIPKPNQVLALGDKYIEGNAEGIVCYIDDSVIQLKNVAETFTNETILSQSLADLESAYWFPVFAYDYELNLNESKRKIKLIDSRYVFDVEQQLTQALK